MSKTGKLAARRAAKDKKRKAKKAEKAKEEQQQEHRGHVDTDKGIKNASGKTQGISGEQDIEQTQRTKQLSMKPIVYYPGRNISKPAPIPAPMPMQMPMQMPAPMPTPVPGPGMGNGMFMGPGFHQSMGHGMSPMQQQSTGNKGSTGFKPQYPIMPIPYNQTGGPGQSGPLPMLPPKKNKQ